MYIITLKSRFVKKIRLILSPSLMLYSNLSLGFLFLCRMTFHNYDTQTLIALPLAFHNYDTWTLIALPSAFHNYDTRTLINYPYLAKILVLKFHILPLDFCILYLVLLQLCHWISAILTRKAKPLCACTVCCHGLYQLITTRHSFMP